MTAYDGNGDMIAKEGQKFRQIGWLINGGPRDGAVVSDEDLKNLKDFSKSQHGGFSPLYIQVGD